MYDAFLVVLIAGCVLMFANLTFATVQKPSGMRVHIVLLLVCMILMFAGYYIELVSTTWDMAWMGTVVSYIGKPFIMLHSLMIICAFYDFKVPRWFFFSASALGAVIFLLVFTNPFTNLYYSTFAFDENDLTAPVLTVNGPLYWIHGVALIASFIGCTIVTINGYRKYKNSQNAKFTVYVLLMVVFVVLGYVFYLSGLSKGYDTTIFGTLAGVICLSMLFYRFRLFDAVSLAKDSALDNSVTGIVVVDSSRKISYANQSGIRYLANGFSIDELMDQAESKKSYQSGAQTISVSKIEIENKGRYVCTSFEIDDITASVNYQTRLEKEVRERTEKIESIQRKSIASLASVVEARSLETGMHIANTRDYSQMIAMALRENGEYRELLTDEYISLLADVTPLHDIGKVSIPDSILLKPGKLTESEFETMKEHTVIGAQIIEKAMRGVEDDKYVDLAVNVALYHHERWTGNGYPKGLKGTEIPLEARIMAVADCFEALISNRCYKKAFTVEESIAILKEESGTHFDPIVVDAFLKAYRESEK